MQQPWATLVTRGAKTTETRGRHTSERGTVLVLATRTIVPFTDAPAPWQVLGDLLGVSPIHLADPDDELGAGLQRGKVIGAVDIVDSVRASQTVPNATVDRSRGWTPWAGNSWLVHNEQFPLGDFGPGRRVWLLERGQHFEQGIICRGMPGMFAAPPDVEREALLQIVRRVRLACGCAVQVPAGCDPVEQLGRYVECPTCGDWPLVVAVA